MHTRNNAAFAEAIYTGDSVIVLPGGRVSEKFASHINGGDYALKFRNDPKYVDSNRNIIKQCEFHSPSIAAQFVNGMSTNGYRKWRVGDVTLGEYLKSEGLR